jgi:hypothetical protein
VGLIKFAVIKQVVEIATRASVLECAGPLALSVGRVSFQKTAEGCRTPKSRGNFRLGIQPATLVKMKALLATIYPAGWKKCSHLMLMFQGDS